MQAAQELTPGQLKREQRLILISAALASVVCVAFLAFAYAIAPRFGEISGGVGERLAFVVQVDLVVLAWLLYAVRAVSSGRYHSLADNRGSAFARPSPRIAVQVAFLQNTLEQAVMAVMAHLAFATVATPRELPMIVGAVALFSLGRLTFRIGYPKGAGARAFGMATTAIPTIAAFAWTMVVLASRAFA